MYFHETDLRALSVAATCNVSCAVVGSFLVVRRISLMADALSHAVLPGLVIAVLVSGGVSSGSLLVGALGAGLVTTLLTGLAQRYGRVSGDASLGVVFTSMFALGVVLVKRYVSKAHFDVSCIYEGKLSSIALDTFTVGSIEVPTALPAALVVLVVVLACVTFVWKELLISSFDPALAHNLRLSPTAMHYLLMTLVSFTAVTSFQAVGSILVVAMLIAPAAAAQLLTDRLPRMLLIAVVIALVATFAGYALSLHWQVSSAGMMACAAGGLYAAAALGSPRYGVISKVVGNARVALRVRREDVLSRLFRDSEQAPHQPTHRGQATAAAGGGLFGYLAVRSLIGGGAIELVPGGLQLTPLGQQRGARLVRAHRLWESYLVDQVGLQADHVHEAAHLVEHFLDERMREEIAEQIQGGQDPHGKQIPQ